MLTETRTNGSCALIGSFEQSLLVMCRVVKQALGNSPPYWFLIPAPAGIQSGQRRTRSNELAVIRGMSAGPR